MRTAAARFYHRNTVSVGPGGAAWPFVALRQPGALFFEYDAQTHQAMWCSGNCEEVLGASEQSINSHGALFLAHLHPSDRFRVSSALETALASGLPYVATYRWLRPDTGDVRLLHCRGLLDGDGTAFRGFISDLTSESAILRANGDVLDTVVDALGCFDSDTLVLDTELRVRLAQVSDSPAAFGLGLDGFDPAMLRAGRFFTECFGIESSRAKAEQFIHRGLELGGNRLVHQWAGFKATFRTVVSSGVVEGVIVELRNNLAEQKLSHRIAELETQVAHLSQMPEVASRAADLGQELLGYAAVVTRSAARDPMLRHLAEALVEVTRELGSVTRELSEPGMQPYTPHNRASATTAMLESKQPIRPTLVFCSSDERTAAVFTSLLRGNGLSASSCILSEVSLREHLVKHPRVRLLVLDVPAAGHGSAALIRAVRRFFPALHIVCLVPGATRGFIELQRAGAGHLLAKPVTPRALERVVRGFLALACGSLDKDDGDRDARFP